MCRRRALGAGRRWLSLLQLALRAAREEEDNEGWSDVPSLPGRRTIPQELTEGRVTHRRARLVNGSWSQTVSSHACVDGVPWVLAAVVIATVAGTEGRQRGGR